MRTVFRVTAASNESIEMIHGVVPGASVSLRRSSATPCTTRRPRCSASRWAIGRRRAARVVRRHLRVQLAEADAPRARAGARCCWCERRAARSHLRRAHRRATGRLRPRPAARARATAPASTSTSPAAARGRAALARCSGFLRFFLWVTATGLRRFGWTRAWRACLIALLLGPRRSRAPEQAHPFPQHVTYAAGTIAEPAQPGAGTTRLRAYYDRWKADFLTSEAPVRRAGGASASARADRIALPASPRPGLRHGDRGAARGHDPGAQALFDGLWAFGARTEHRRPAADGVQVPSGRRVHRQRLRRRLRHGLRAAARRRAVGRAGDVDYAAAAGR